MVAVWLGILSSGIVASPRKPGLNLYHIIWLYYAGVGDKTENRYKSGGREKQPL